MVFLVDFTFFLVKVSSQNFRSYLSETFRLHLKFHVHIFQCQEGTVLWLGYLISVLSLL